MGRNYLSISSLQRCNRYLICVLLVSLHDVMQTYSTRSLSSKQLSTWRVNAKISILKQQHAIGWLNRYKSWRNGHDVEVFSQTIAAIQRHSDANPLSRFPDFQYDNTWWWSWPGHRFYFSYNGLHITITWFAPDSDHQMNNPVCSKDNTWRLKSRKYFLMICRVPCSSHYLTIFTYFR